MSNKLKPEDFIKKVKELEIRKSRTTILMILFLSISIIAYVLFTSKKVDEKLVEIQKIEDTTHILTRHINTEDSAKKTILDFFKFQNQNDTASILSILSDTLNRYYLIDKKIEKDKLKQSKQFEVVQKGKYIIDSFTVSNNHDTLSALILTKLTSFNRDTIKLAHEIKLDLNYQIFYVRAYRLTAVSKPR